MDKARNEKYKNVMKSYKHECIFVGRTAANSRKIPVDFLPVVYFRTFSVPLK
jgi:hypothetical protein